MRKITGESMRLHTERNLPLCYDHQSGFSHSSTASFSPRARRRQETLIIGRKPSRRTELHPIDDIYSADSEAHTRTSGPAPHTLHLQQVISPSDESTRLKASVEHNQA